MDIKKIEQGFSSMSNPQNYFKGFGKNLFSQPENILFFYRGQKDLYTIEHDLSFHCRHVFIFNLGDSLTIVADSNPILLKQDHALLLLPYQYHKFKTDKNKSLSLLMITFEMSNNICWEYTRYKTIPFSISTKKRLEESYQLYKDHKEYELSFMVGCLFSGLLEQNIKEKNISYSKMIKSNLVGEICTLILKNKSLSIKELSSKIDYSESYLRRIFYKKMGVTLGQYMIEVKLTDAMYFLSSTKKNISEIAFLVGYQNIYSFSRSFKTHLGMTPSLYRKKSKGYFSGHEMKNFKYRQNETPPRERPYINITD